MPKAPVIGNIVEEYYIEGTHIKICDDAYKNITELEINNILDRINTIGVKIVLAKQNQVANVCTGA